MDKNKTKRFYIRIFLCIGCFWIILISCSLFWNLKSIKNTVVEIARQHLNAVYEKDILYQDWAASIGGLYVDSEKVEPNPCLSFIKGRDVITNSGKKLTLINPAYLTRLIYEISRKRFKISAHLISLKPLNPLNTPDKWEKDALIAFEKGVKEKIRIEKREGQKFVQLIKPLFVEKPCLKCHGSQGYKVGDIRGAISITVPFTSYANIILKRQINIFIIHLIICILGLGILFWIFKLISRNYEKIAIEKERLKTLIDAMPDIVCFKDGEGRWLEANKFDLHLFGLENVDYKGKKDSELAAYSEHYKDAFLMCEKTDERAWLKGKLTRGEEIIPIPNGDYKVFDVIKVPLFDEKGNRKGLIVIGRDITEAKKAQKQLERLSKLKGLILRLAIDFINIPPSELYEQFDRSLKLIGEYLNIDRAYFLKVNSKEGFVFLSNEWCAPGIASRSSKFDKIPLSRFLECFKKHSIKDIIQIYTVQELMDGLLKQFLEDFDTKSSIILPVIYDNKYLGAIGLDTVKESREWDQDLLIILKLMSVIYSNALMRAQVYETLEESEIRYRELYERMPIGLYRNTPGPKGRFIMVNKALVDMFGYKSAEEMLQVPVVDLYPDSSQRYNFSERLIREGNIRNYEMQLKKKDGTLFWVSITANVIKDFHGNVLYFEGAIFDITKRKAVEKERVKLQLQLQQAQKLESIGRLAGGVAHDLNNFLVPILGYNELLLNRLSKDSPEYLFVKRVSEAAERARDIVRQLLVFSRKDIFDIVSLNLNKLLIEFERLLRRTIREDIEIVLELAPDLPTIKADKRKIEQVILNLAINAQDAMPDGGTLTIETALVELDEEYASSHRDVIPGSYICLSISDTGHGMDEETMKHIFEPFFTTKPKESGTGLGLSTAYGIVRQHKGSIWVYSEVGKGTTFKIYLPVSGEEEIIKTDIEYLDKELEGTETVLLVEDNDAVRELVRDTLKEHGYKVLEAKEPIMAIKKARDFKDKIQLLLTDVIMPKMNGKELYEKLVQFFPDLEVVYMSGYTENVISEHGVLKRGIHFISKPFSRVTLLKTIKKALSKKQ